MITEQYNNLSIQEKRELHNRTNHLLTTDADFLLAVQGMLRSADLIGAFQNVSFPEEISEPKY